MSGEGAKPIGIVRSQRSAERLASDTPGKIVIADKGRHPFGPCLRRHCRRGRRPVCRRAHRPDAPASAPHSSSMARLAACPCRYRQSQARPDVRFSFLWLRTWVHAAGRPAIEAAFAQSFAGLRTGLFSSRIAANLPARVAWMRPWRIRRILAATASCCSIRAVENQCFRLGAPWTLAGWSTSFGA